jgi:AraC-like DNA-binding protein
MQLTKPPFKSTEWKLHILSQNSPQGKDAGASSRDLQLSLPERAAPGSQVQTLSLGQHVRLAPKLVIRNSRSAVLCGTEKRGGVRGDSGTAYLVEAAERFTLDGIAESVSMGELARFTGVSPRTLHEGFRKHRGYSPMQFLREQRMQRVRQQLSDAPGGTSVTEVALNWGFSHLGRFSLYYAKRFGEKPSVTLARGRALTAGRRHLALAARAS